MQKIFQVPIEGMGKRGFMGKFFFLTHWREQGFITGIAENLQFSQNGVEM